MTHLLIEMPSGVAGDMLLAGLIGLGVDQNRLQDQLNDLGVGPLPLRCTPVSPGGIQALQVDIEVPQEANWSPGSKDHGHEHSDHQAQQQDGHHHAHSHDHQHGHGHSHGHEHSDHQHRSFAEIRRIIKAATLSERVRQQAITVFSLLAEAEGAVHGMDPEQVHFHEVGSLDAIADVVGCCLALEALGVERITAAPLTLGSGHVHCAHGRMPVPVPAVCEILQRSGAPSRRLNRETGELTTPTGCALVCALADDFATDSVASPTATAYGAGHKEIPGLTNIIRVSLSKASAGQTAQDQVVELRCVIDDASGEVIAQVMQRLLAEGAKDCYVLPAMMKKGRPGHELVVLGNPQDKDLLSNCLLEHSTAIGLRYHFMHRQILERQHDTISIDGESIAIKTVTLPSGSTRSLPEADAIAAAASKLDCSFEALYRRVIAQIDQA